MNGMQEDLKWLFIFIVCKWIYKFSTFSHSLWWCHLSHWQYKDNNLFSDSKQRQAWEFLHYRSCVKRMFVCSLRPEVNFINKQSELHQPACTFFFFYLQKSEKILQHTQQRFSTVALHLLRKCHTSSTTGLTWQDYKDKILKCVSTSTSPACQQGTSTRLFVWRTKGEKKKVCCFSLIKAWVAEWRSLTRSECWGRICFPHDSSQNLMILELKRSYYNNY